MVAQDADIDELSNFRADLHDEGYRFAQDDHSLIVYADGSCINNGSATARAGMGLWWGDYGDAWENSACYRLPGRDQTNNRAELYALILAVQECPYPQLRLEIRTDSLYAVNCVNTWIHKWRDNDYTNCRGYEVTNSDLIKRFDNLRNSRRARVFVVHVPGHEGIEGNEMADQLARSAARG